MRLATLLSPDLKQLLREDPDQVRELLDEIHAEDLADIVSELEPDEAAQLLARLPADEAAPIFERLDETEQEELAELMAPESVAHIASEMEPDDRADLFSVLPDAIGDKILETLERVDPEAAEAVREIEKWPDTSAGHLMTTNYVYVQPSVRVEEALQAVRAYSIENENIPIYNVYALTPDDKVVGIASLRDLIVNPGKELLENVLRTNIISVPPDMDQEEVARRMAKYDLNAMPVIATDGTLLGVITIDDVIDVLTQEQTEDVQKLGGIEPLDVPYFQTRFGEFIRKRGGWLVILFVGEFFTQTALRFYDPVFQVLQGASYYIPLLISAGGNSGSQSSTLIIRGLAVGEIRGRDWWRVLLRELAMGLVLGAILGVIGFARVLMYRDQSMAFAFTIAVTLVGIVVTGCTIGSMLPLVLKKIGLDPATSSTPFIASLVDVAGIVVFVHVARIVMANVLAAGIPHGSPVP
ncbi:magnesium transporter [Pendulispora brunnea]|uniref:Magnesium transporter MgtE n=1 Tax=Pendulispora brunnea TaxID=2905690 RepID=A0ABZ2KGX0_9BACT